MFLLENVICQFYFCEGFSGAYHFGTLVNFSTAWLCSLLHPIALLLLFKIKKCVSLSITFILTLPFPDKNIPLSLFFIYISIVWISHRSMGQTFEIKDQHKKKCCDPLRQEETENRRSVRSRSNPQLSHKVPWYSWTRDDMATVHIIMGLLY